MVNIVPDSGESVAEGVVVGLVAVVLYVHRPPTVV
jgi:hypothetical protein